MHRLRIYRLHPSYEAILGHARSTLERDGERAIRRSREEGHRDRVRQKTLEELGRVFASSIIYVKLVIPSGIGGEEIKLFEGDLDTLACTLRDEGHRALELLRDLPLRPPIIIEGDGRGADLDITRPDDHIYRASGLLRYGLIGGDLVDALDLSLPPSTRGASAHEDEGQGSLGSRRMEGLRREITPPKGKELLDTRLGVDRLLSLVIILLDELLASLIDIEDTGA